MIAQYILTPPGYGAPQVEQSKRLVGLGRLEVEMYALTQEEGRPDMDLINSTNKIYSYDGADFQHISDSASAYFAGARKCAGEGGADRSEPLQPLCERTEMRLAPGGASHAPRARGGKCGTHSDVAPRAHAAGKKK
jgi:hypothetical protein